MESVTYPHLEPQVMSPTPTSKDSIGTLGRALSFAVGVVTVWIQVNYTWASLPQGDLAQKTLPVLFAVGLAGSLVAVERHWRMWQWVKSIFWLWTFCILLLANLQTTITRVAEIRSLKSAIGEHAGDIQREAKDALKKALATEDEAKANMAMYCSMVKTDTATETNSKGKKQVSSTKKVETVVDPRCEQWRQAYSDAGQKTTLAREAVANSAVTSSANGVSPAAKSISILTKWNEVTVDHAMDFVQPIGLDALALVAFLTAFSVHPRQRAPRIRKQKPAPLPVPVTPNGTAIVPKGIAQAEVNELVEKWIEEKGLPVGDGMGAALKSFIEWANVPEQAVSFVTFGRAFDALNIERRSLGGRKVIAGRKIR